MESHGKLFVIIRESHGFENFEFGRNPVDLVSKFIKADYCGQIKHFNLINKILWVSI